jgi:hypothetical protein
MIEIPKEPKKRDLAVFGALMGPFFALIGWSLYRHVESHVPAYAVWGGGGLLWLVYLAWPAARKAIFVGWLYAVFPIGWTISHAIVVTFYYLVLTPVGLVLRLVGRDPMERGDKYRRDSYWTVRPRPDDTGRYFRQY